MTFSEGDTEYKGDREPSWFSYQPPPALSNRISCDEEILYLRTVQHSNHSHTRPLGIWNVNNKPKKFT